MEKNNHYLRDDDGEIAYLSIQKSAELATIFAEFASNRSRYFSLKNCNIDERMITAEITLDCIKRIYNLPKEFFEELKDLDQSLEDSLRVLETECKKDLI